MLCVIALLLFSWVIIYSASAILAENRYGDQYFFLKRQMIWTFLGVIVFAVSSNISLKFWQSMVKPIYFIVLASLIAVLALGPEIAGARRWFRLGSISIQPSELAKLASVLLVADYCDRRQSRMLDFKKGLLPLLILFGVMTGLIFIEPDLGTPFLMSLVFVALLLAGGAQWKHLIGLGMGALALFSLALFQYKYRVARLFAYLDPWSDAQGAGYQLVQSLLAMGSGGIWGRGLGQSRVKISNLPDPHTDFIFSVIGEEMGLIGTIICLGIFVYICMKGLKIAQQAPDVFTRMTAMGISLTIGFQSIINMGVATGLFPTKGMPLPFISFGGSSLLIFMMSMGILFQISHMSRSAKSKAFQ